MKVADLVDAGAKVKRLAHEAAQVLKNPERAPARVADVAANVAIAKLPLGAREVAAAVKKVTTEIVREGPER